MRLRVFLTPVKPAEPEAGRAEAGTWKKFMQISLIRGRRPQLQRCPHSFVSILNLMAVGSTVPVPSAPLD